MKIPSRTGDYDRIDDTAAIGAQAARSGGAMFVAKCVRFASLMIVNYILINLLLPADFGLVRYVVMIVAMAAMLNELGLTAAIVQYNQLDPHSLWSLFVLSSLWGCGLYAALFILAPPLANFLNAPELVWLLRIGSLSVPLSGMSAVQRAYLRRGMAYGTLARMEIAASVISVAIALLIAFAGLGVWALMAASLLFEAVNSSIILLRCHICRAPLQSFSTLRPLIFFGLTIIISRLVDYLLGVAPFFMVGKIIDKNTLGLFSVASDMALMPQTAILSVLSPIMLSMFSRLQSDDQKTAGGLHRLLLFGSIIAMPISLIMAFLPRELLQVICLFRQNDVWLEAAPQLKWLALMGTLYVFTTFSSSIWVSRGKVGSSIAVSAAMCGTVILAIIAGVRWGITGICIALLIRSLIVFWPYMYINKQLTGIPIRTYLSALLPALGAGAGMALTMTLCRHLLTYHTSAHFIVVLTVTTAVGVGAYGAILATLFTQTLHHLRSMADTLLRGRAK